MYTLSTIIMMVVHSIPFWNYQEKVSIWSGFLAKFCKFSFNHSSLSATHKSLQCTGCARSIESKHICLSRNCFSHQMNNFLNDTVLFHSICSVVCLARYLCLYCCSPWLSWESRAQDFEMFDSWVRGHLWSWLLCLKSGYQFTIFLHVSGMNCFESSCVDEHSVNVVGLEIRFVPAYECFEALQDYILQSSSTWAWQHFV